ncbi:hypothetical protein [Kitasatospora cinereorecta]|uniref:Uncharacterized protein n=1 Tax=Kitasatospora cinereorecta TaxID=285560 RepID=A0ABW0VNF5_9ACTN
MTRKNAPTATCPLHDKYTAKKPGACPLGPQTTIQNHLLALLEHEAGQPIDLTRRWRHRPTRRALRTLAHRIGPRPHTLYRHAKGSRWPAGAYVRNVVDRCARNEFCLERLIEADVYNAQVDARAARRRSAATIRGKADAQAREEALRRRLGG